VFALAGDSRQAEILNRELTSNFPYDTMQINFWRPITLAAIHMRHNSPERALKELRAASPYEMGASLSLLPAYLRGQAYLALHRGPEAVAEFQKLIDTEGWSILFTRRWHDWASRSEVELHTELQLSCIADGTEYRIKRPVLNIPVWNA